jgi:hypothetical protein
MEILENLLFSLYLFFFVLLVFKQLYLHSTSVASSLSSYLPVSDPKSKWQDTRYGKNFLQKWRQQQEKRIKQKKQKKQKKQQKQQQQQQNEETENDALLPTQKIKKSTVIITKNLNIILVFTFIILNIVSLFQSSKEWYDVMTTIVSILFFLGWLLVIWSPDNYAPTIQSTFMMFCIAFFCWNIGLLIFTKASKKITIMLLLITSYYGIIIRQNLNLNNSLTRNR